MCVPMLAPPPSASVNSSRFSWPLISVSVFVNEGGGVDPAGL